MSSRLLSYLVLWYVGGIGETDDLADETVRLVEINRRVGG